MGFREQGDIPERILDNYYLAGVGAKRVGYLRFTGNVADTETITIGGRVYEFDTNSTYTAGRVPINVSAGVTPATAAPATIAAINGDSGRSVYAVTMTANVVGLIAASDGDDAIALAEATANVVVSAAALTNGYDEVETNFVRGQYVVTAADVTAWAAGDEVIIGAGTFATIAPVLVSFVVRTSANQIRGLTTASFVIQLTQATGLTYYVETADAAADLGAGDIISWAAIG